MEPNTQRTFTLKSGGAVVAESFDSAQEMERAFPVRTILLETERETVWLAKSFTLLFEESMGAKSSVAYTFGISESSTKLFMYVLKRLIQNVTEERTPEPQGGSGNSGAPLVPALGVPQVLPKKEKRPPIWQQKVWE